MDTFLQLLFPVLATAAMYTLAAVSLNIIYAPSGVLNFGQGSLVAFGGLLGAGVYVHGGFPFALALVIVLGAGAGLGIITYYVGARRFIGGVSPLGWLLGTLGVSVIVENVSTKLWGTEPVAFPPLFGLSRDPLTIGELAVTPSQLVIIGSAIGVLIVVELITRSTRLGWAMAAIAQDSEAAEARGLPVALLTLGAFAVGAALAAFTGLVAAPITQAWAYIGFGLLVKAFTVMVLGGVGRNLGAALAALILAAIELYATHWLPILYRDSVALLVLLVVLLVRPQGLFGLTRVRAV